MNAAYWALHYLKGIPDYGILIRATSDITLSGYSDFDWGTCPLTRRSFSGYLVTLGRSPISWKTKKQQTVSQSSAEAEYHSMAAATNELIWLKSLLAYLGFFYKHPMHLSCDSQAAIHIAKNPVFLSAQNTLKLIVSSFVNVYIASKNRPADIFTKAVGKRQFQYLWSTLGMVKLHAPTWGGMLRKLYLV